MQTLGMSIIAAERHVLHVVDRQIAAGDLLLLETLAAAPLAMRHSFISIGAKPSSRLPGASVNPHLLRHGWSHTLERALRGAGLVHCWAPCWIAEIGRLRAAAERTIFVESTPLLTPRASSPPLVNGFRRTVWLADSAFARQRLIDLRIGASDCVAPMSATVAPNEAFCAGLTLNVDTGGAGRLGGGQTIALLPSHSPGAAFRAAWALLLVRQIHARACLWLHPLDPGLCRATGLLRACGAAEGLRVARDNHDWWGGVMSADVVLHTPLVTYGADSIRLASSSGAPLVCTPGPGFEAARHDGSCGEVRLVRSHAARDIAAELVAVLDASPARCAPAIAQVVRGLVAWRLQQHERLGAEVAC